MSAKANTQIARAHGMTTDGKIATFNTGIPHQAPEMESKRKKEGDGQNVEASRQDGPQSTAWEGLFGTPEDLKPGMSNVFGRHNTTDVSAKMFNGPLGRDAPAVNVVSTDNYAKDQSRMVTGSGGDELAKKFWD